MIVSLALVIALLQAGPASPPSGRPTIVTTLSQSGADALIAELERIAPGRYSVAFAEGLPDLSRLARDPEGSVVAFYGVAAAQLEELRVLDGVPNFVRLESDRFEPSPIDPEDRGYAVLFADCVVLAIDRARAEHDLGRRIDTILPTSLAALAAGKFEGAFFASAPDLGNAAGAWIGRVAFSEPSETESLLVAFGANLVDRETPHDFAALERTRAEGPPTFALVAESSLRRGRPEDSLEGLRVFGSSLAIVRGFARLPGSEETAAHLASLLEADSVRRVAAAERVVPLRGSETELSDTDLSVRRAIEMEGPRIGLEIGKIREWVPRYRTELRERLGKRRQRFEDVYDVVFLAALALAGGWLLLRRKPADDLPRRGRADR